MKRHKGPCAREPAYRQCPNQAASDDQELFRQQRLDDPHWEGKQLRVAVGRAVQTHDGMTVVFSVLNSSSRTIELLPPQIQLAGKSKDQHSKTIKAEPVAIKDYRLTARRQVRGRTELSSSNVQALGRLSKLAVSQHIVVTISADTPIYVVLEQTPRSKASSVQSGLRSTQPGNAANAEELRQLLQLQRELNQSGATTK